MTYYIYHIPGKKIGVTRDLKQRVEKQQGYSQDEYDVIMKSDNIDFISEQEIYLQKMYGYRIDDEPYNKLKFNNMNINITEQTTTFPCPVSKLKGQLMDNIGLEWETEHGKLSLTTKTVDWIMKNIITSKYNSQRCYIYNKAFARFYDNNEAYPRTGGIMMDHRLKVKNSQFDLIRAWAKDRGLYDKGDVKTQTLKLMEEAGEICKATLKEDYDEVLDGIGDCVVVLTNLAHLHGVEIEECIQMAYDVISKRTGKMVNGTFKKD